jgi:hypothetical protein
MPQKRKDVPPPEEQNLPLTDPSQSQQTLQTAVSKQSENSDVVIPQQTITAIPQQPPYSCP